jgi:hypothetical protein
MPMEMDEAKVEELIRKLRKRGFITDGVREFCPTCTQRAQAIFKISSQRQGGRDIRWCFACGKIQSWRRLSDDQLVEDQAFDLEKFLT